MSLYSELKRRNVIRVAVAYLVVSWLLYELANFAFPALGIPASGIRVLAILCALGFLPALALSWAYALTPDGIVRNMPIARTSARPLDVITVCLVVAALAILVINRAWFRADPAVATAPLAEGVPVVQESEPAAHRYPPNSIAVLPFVNMSDDASNEYFSDGVSEELLNLLSKVPELRVISRSSAFSFKDKDINVPAVAQALNVAHVLEGSVRKSGERVRITVQLIDARTDTHLWSGTYDRMLDDIFAIQDDIAREVVEQLKVTLLGETTRSGGIDPQAYTMFLQARQLGKLFTVDAFEQSIALYQEALALDPAYAEAWAGLAANYINQMTTGQRSAGEGTRLAREAALQALAFDPGCAAAHAHLSRIALRYDRDLQAAARHLQRALELEPANPDILRHAATLLRTLDRLPEAIAVDEYVVDRDPVNPAGHYFLGFSYLLARQLDHAIAAFDRALTLSPGHVSAHYRIGTALVLKGEPRRALEEMLLEPRPTKHLMGEAMAYEVLGRAEEADAALAELVEKYRDTTAYNIAYLMAFRGDADGAFAWLDKAAQYRDAGLIQIANQPEFDNVRDDPRWLPFLESIGMSPAQLDAIEFNVSLPD
jgi:TolB-like protein/Flp pilus assembly protein TadD